MISVGVYGYVFLQDVEYVSCKLIHIKHYGGK